jgi:hypothetical protein
MSLRSLSIVIARWVGVAVTVGNGWIGRSWQPTASSDEIKIAAKQSVLVKKGQQPSA